MAAKASKQTIKLKANMTAPTNKTTLTSIYLREQTRLGGQH
jgi:hypothetical protein